MREFDALIEDSFPRWLPSWILLIFIRPYYNQGGIYIEDHYTLGECPVHISSRIKWLETIEIWTYSKKRADKLSRDFFHSKYPQYGGFIKLF